MFLIFQPDNIFTFNGTLEVQLSMTRPVPAYMVKQAGGKSQRRRLSF